MRLHRALFIAACVLPTSLLACGGDSDSDGDDDPDVVPTGEHYGYVVSKATAVPTASTSATELGLDLGSSTSSKRDGKVDNRLGTALGGLSGIFNVQTTIDTAVSHGTLLLLADFQTTSFTNNTDGAALAVKFGATATPAPCTDAADTTCGHHLSGSATFTVDPASPNAALEGQVVNGTFKSNAGDISLKLTLGTDAPIQLDLHHARAQASGMTDAKITTLVVGGLLTSADLKTKIGPVIKAQVDAVLTAGCTGSGAGCGCTGNAATAQKLLDTNGDCTVTTDELFAAPTVAQFLAPDSCSQDTCTEPDAVSLGIKVEAVKASF